MSKSKPKPETIDPDYQEEDEDREDEENFLDQLNRAVVHKSKSSRSMQRGQDNGISM